MQFNPSIENLGSNADINGFFHFNFFLYLRVAKIFACVSFDYFYADFYAFIKIPVTKQLHFWCLDVYEIGKNVVGNKNNL